MKIVVFASGSGSNAENIIHHFAGSSVTIAAIFCKEPIDWAYHVSYSIEKSGKPEIALMTYWLHIPQI